MHTLNVEKSRWTAREISLTAAMTAVVFLLTFVPKIPIPLGYARLGDAAIFVMVCLAGRREALVAACHAGGFYGRISPVDRADPHHQMGHG